MSNDRREPQRTPSKLGYDQAGQRMQEQAARDPMALVRQQVKVHQAFLAQRTDQLQRWIAAGIDPRALVRYAILDMSAPKADKLRACSPQSIYMGLLACAVAGLEPGALKGHAFLVPFKGQAQYMAGWKGYVVQARRSFEVRAITPNVVFANDTFDLDLGGGMPPVHKPLLTGPRGDIIGAYAVAKLVGSRDSVVSYEVEWMDRADLDGVRRAGPRGDKESDAWVNWEDQMWRKAPVRRIAKRLPMGADYYKGLAIEQAQDDGKNASDVIDVLTDGEATRVEEAAERGSSMRAQATGSPTDDEAAEIAALEAAELARQQGDRNGT